uniref:Glucosidase 2 subunit beta n=1 Tax=Panagrolaimus sp. ES5 TaxID=591445 RepID=A0AC34GVL4_9BILA
MLKISTSIFLLPLLSLLIVAEKDHGYGNRPRGVPLSKASLYKEKNEFECLDGSKTIPFEQINDDYCDCFDGSDEPGTSACANGRFHCINLGYKSMDVPSSRVNDFICDCCDGSDEQVEISGVQCPNICSQMGAKAREAAEEHKKTVTAGFAKRADLAKEGQKLVKEKTGGVDELRKQLETLQATKDEFEKKKTAAEEKEKAAREVEDKVWDEERNVKRRNLATELFEKLDANKDGKIRLDDLKLIVGLDQDSNGEVSDDEAKNYLYGLEELDFEAFFEKAFNQLRRILKEKVVKPVEEVIETVKTEKPETAEGEGEGESEEENLEDDTPIETEEKQGDDDDDLDVRPPYSPETLKIVEETAQIRNEFTEAVQKLSEIEATIKDSESFIEFDYGPDSAWAPLKGQCFELNENQYTYKLCIFDKSSQKDKNGYSEVSLGHWNSWSGPENDKFSAQKYDKGQNCWNGPDRSTNVVIKCGEETKLVEATEPSKCEYRFVLLSPAACQDPAKLEEQHHSEL